VLTSLQRQIASIVGSLPNAQNFALAGGAALIARGDVDRLTRDLDFFGPSAAEVDLLVPLVELAFREAGLSVQRVREGSGFYRLEVSQGADVTEVDFGADFRLLPMEVGPLGQTLAGEELAVNKVLAVFGRAEARDFVDLSVLTKRYGLERLMRRALEKDPGFDPQVFRNMLSRFERLPRDEFEISDEGYEGLVRTIEHWRTTLLDVSTDRLLRKSELERDDDMGIGR
jgi:nucleotidyltransferase AbiEii toxin of type IV toxin-antitoxin system